MDGWICVWEMDYVAGHCAEMTVLTGCEQSSTVSILWKERCVFAARGAGTALRSPFDVVVFQQSAEG